MFMEYDPSANTLSTYQEASIRIQRRSGCEWGQLRDGWRVFSFVVCKGRQPQITKAAHTVHRFISLVFPSQQQQGSSSSSSCSPPLPQQQQGSSHCCCPPLPQYNEMEPLLTDTIHQLRKEKEDLLREIQELQGYREHHDLLLAENLQLKEEKCQLSWELQQLKESQEHARNSSSSCEPPTNEGKLILLLLLFMTTYLPTLKVFLVRKENFLSINKILS